VGVHYEHATDLIGFADCPAGPPASVRPNFADAPPAIGDLDGDGTNEIVVIGSFYDCGDANYQQLFQIPIVLNADRTRWVAAGGFDWTALPAPDGAAAPLSTDYNVIQSAEANPVLADLDGDGVKEILYASYDGRVHAFWASDRTEHGAWPFDVNLGETALHFASEPVVADLDGDGKAEVVFTTWTANGSNQTGDLYIVDALGSEITHVALPRSAESWDGALGAPTIANLDADPQLEVVVGTANTGLVAYEIPGSFSGRAPWPTGRGNVMRTAPEPGASAAMLAAVGAVALLARRRRKQQ
jgi:MYXO-CTERM domain-containing protein